MWTALHGTLTPSLLRRQRMTHKKYIALGLWGEVGRDFTIKTNLNESKPSVSSVDLSANTDALFRSEDVALGRCLLHPWVYRNYCLKKSLTRPHFSLKASEEIGVHSGRPRAIKSGQMKNRISRAKPESECCAFKIKDLEEIHDWKWKTICSAVWLLDRSHLNMSSVGLLTGTTWAPEHASKITFLWNLH